MKYKVRFIQPTFPSSKQLAEDYNEIVGNNWYTNFGPFEKEFRSSIEKYIGNDIKAATVANATLGLMLAINHFVTKGSHRKNKILIPSFTFVAGAEAILWNGFEPIFFDMDAKLVQPSIVSASAYLSKHGHEVAGIMLCNTLGVGNPEIDKWERLARQFNLPLIIDSAAGFGSAYADGEKVGARGDCEVFSFHATKSFGIGEGGAITSRNEGAIIDMVKSQNFGFDDSKNVAKIGLNAKLQEINAGIGIRKMNSIDFTLKKDVLSEYKARLRTYGFTFQPNDENSSLSFVSIIAPSPYVATRLLKRLQDCSIEAKNYYNPALHKLDLLKQYTTADSLINTTYLCDRIVSLPCHAGVTEEVLDDIEVCAKESLSN